MKDFKKNAAEVKAAANKKPYMKPDFEVINLEYAPQLLAASNTTTMSGTATQYRTLSNGSWN